MIEFRRLGGEVIETDEWDERVTHVIAHVDGKKESMSEKVMAGLAGGRWVLTKRWMDKCVRRGSWLPSPALYITSEAVIRHRKNWHQHGPRAAVFHGVRAALVMSDPRRNGVYGRIIRAGAGTVVKCHSLHQLCTRPPRPGEITHIVIDPWILTEADPRHHLFSKFRNINDERQLNIHFIYYKYLFMKIRQFPEPHHTDYSIFNPKIQEMGAKDFEILSKQMPSLNRVQEDSLNENGKKRRLEDTDVVTLEDSDEEEETTTPPPNLKLARIEGLIVQKIAAPSTNVPHDETGYVSQSQPQVASMVDFVTPPVDDNSLLAGSSSSDIVEVTRDAGIVAIPVPIESMDKKDFQVSTIVQNGEDESDDDDIQVLEQKLAASRQELGNVRHYLETDKATSRSKKVINSVKRASVYIPSQKEEYMRQHELSRTLSRNCEDSVEMVTLDDSESDSEERLSGEVTVTNSGRSLDFSPARDSETQHDEDPDMNDGVEMHAPAPDIVNIESDTDEEEVDACRNSIDAEPDTHDAVTFKNKYRSIPTNKGNLKVRSQREEFLLTFSETERVREVKSQREEFLIASKETLRYLETVESESKLSNESRILLTNKIKSQVQEQQHDHIAQIIPGDVELDYQDVFQEPDPKNRKGKVEDIRKNIENIFQEYQDIFQEPEEQAKVVTITNKLKSTSDADKVKNKEGLEEKISTEPLDMDDESDFSLSEGEEEETEVKLQNIPVSTLKNLTKASVKINVGRLSPAKLSYHMNILQEYLTKKKELAAPDVDKQDGSHKPVLSTLSQTPQKQSTSLLFRILATINKRFSLTHELLAISHSPYVAESVYDTHGEKPIKASTKISNIPSSVDVDFVHLTRKTDDDNDDYSNENSDVDEAEVFPKQKTEYASDSITCIKRLKMETCSTVTPNSKILNILFKNLLLEESNHYVIHSAMDYLNHFLFLHGNSPDRFVWHSTILSALRNLKDDKLFRSFNLSNAQDLVLCTEFWRDLIEKVIQNCLFTKYSEEFRESYDVESSGSLGPFMLLQFLVKLLQKDFGTWWQHHKKRNLSLNQVGELPLLFYLLGGSTRDLMKMIKSSILKLYKHFLKTDHCLEEARKLLSMAAILVSHLDYHEEYG